MRINNIYCDIKAEHLAEIISELDADLDMESVEMATKHTMAMAGIHFKSFVDLMYEADDNDLLLIVKFDSTEEYFFDRINTQKITEAKIKSLVEQCMVFPNERPYSR